ncbi:unnamed protein product, partial [Mycena citricolor]
FEHHHGSLGRHQLSDNTTKHAMFVLTLMDCANRLLEAASWNNCDTTSSSSKADVVILDDGARITNTHRMSSGRRPGTTDTSHRWSLISPCQSKTANDPPRRAICCDNRGNVLIQESLLDLSCTECMQKT